MKIQTIESGPVAANTYIVREDAGNKGLVIDPGAYSRELMEAIEGLDIPTIVNTHGHFDHIGGNEFVKERKNSSIAVHFADAPMLTDGMKNFSGYFAIPQVSPPADILITSEDFKLEVGSLLFDIFFFPGHTDGCIGLYHSKDGVLFSGDFIFSDTIGRTDFPGGSMEKMKESIKKVLLLPDDTLVYPGHNERFYLKEFKKIANYFLEA